MTKVICIGECMVELRRRADGAFDQGFAGDAYNVAAYLKRSAPEFDVCFLTATGADALSLQMRAAWRDEGVSDALAFETGDAIPGLYLINVDGAGERTFTYWRSASAARQWFTLLQANGGVDAFRGADLLYFSGISLAILPEQQRAPALALLAQARANGIKIAFDLNYRAALWHSADDARRALNAAMNIADIVRPSRDDLDALSLEPPPHAENVTTFGADGCAVRTPDLYVELRAPRPSQVLDTSGAGDAFTGAYLAARLRGDEPKAAAHAALDVGARVVTAAGALVPKITSHPRGHDE